MRQKLRHQRLWELLEQFPRAVLYRIARAAQTPVRGATRKHELIEVLSALPEEVLERALIEGLTWRDLQALCARIGRARSGTKGALATRILAAVDEPAMRPRWRPFAEARAFARRLALNRREEWLAFARGRLPAKAALPADIPRNPDSVYAKSGWTGWGDFLGTGNLASHQRTFRPFAEARAFARSLALTSSTEWLAFARGALPARGTLPADIPKTPQQTYAKSGWTSWGDFLGTGNLASYQRTWRPFAQARVFARSLALTSSEEWFAFGRGDLPAKGTLPEDIPKTPDRAYAKSGWTSWGDFLGTGNLASYQRTFRSFAEARAFARRLTLKSSDEWFAFARGHLPVKGTLPKDIPRTPQQTYAKSGWTSWGDFLGTGNQSARGKTFRAFLQARAYVRSLGLASFAEWRALCRAPTGDQAALPPDIPATPHKVYAGRGWAGYGDWLGTGRIRASPRLQRSYEEACAFVRGLGIRSESEWRKYCRGQLDGHAPRPRDIPAHPHQVYRGRGWVSWERFLGPNAVAKRKRAHRPFVAARTYARSLGLRNVAAWTAWSAAGHRPADIPADPAQSYRGKGWVSWGDFLGTGNVHPSRARRRSFTAARAFVRRLGLRSAAEYRRAWRAGRIPRDIPATIDLHPEWKGWVDFLGPSYTGRPGPKSKTPKRKQGRRG